MMSWYDRRQHGTRPDAQLKLRVRKRRASKCARWDRRVELHHRGTHLRWSNAGHPLPEGAMRPWYETEVAWTWSEVEV